MHAQHDAVAPRQVAVHPFDLVRIHVGGRALHRRRQVDDHLAGRRRSPDGADRIADLEREIQLGQAEGLGRVFVDPLRLRMRVGQRADLAGAGQRDLLDLGAAHAEHDAAPLRRYRVVQVHDGARRAAQRLEGARDQVGPRLGQDLDGDVGGNAAFLDQLAHEIEIRVGRRGKRHFDLLQADRHQLLEKAQLAGRVHGVDQRLVAVAHVGAHPDRRCARTARGPLAFCVVARKGLDGAVLVLGMVEHGNLRPRGARRLWPPVCGGGQAREVAKGPFRGAEAAGRPRGARPGNRALVVASTRRRARQGCRRDGRPGGLGRGRKRAGRPGLRASR